MYKHPFFEMHDMVSEAVKAVGVFPGNAKRK